MKIQILKGDDIQKDKNTLYDNIEDSEVVFVLDNPKVKLCEYIDKFNLNESGDLYTMKICKEIRPIDVDYQGKYYSKFSDLLQNLDLETESTIIVKGDLDESRKAAVRTQLSAIVQQFVYLDIPLGKIQVVTEQEAKDLVKIKRYEENVNLYEQLAKQAYAEIDAKNFPNNEDLKNQVLASLKKIQDYIAESRETELKVAVAASKKSGKSVVVNSMLEYELAPTSLELATPNNCVYISSDRYYLKYKGEIKYFDTSQQVREYILPIFKSAEFDKDNQYAIEDMEIGYVPVGKNLSSLTIYDTPGPDLAGASHCETAKNAIKVSDVLIFPIDYTKYLTDTETAYLKEIRDTFAKNRKFYSLIFDINKTDQRFVNEGDKCQTRVIDFIREKLISIAPEFEDSIIFGTSALTYFNALETPKINGFEDLENTDAKVLEYEIGNRMVTNKLNGEQKTKLKFLKDQVGNASTFMNQCFTNLEQVKQFSGMPDLLNYVKYITQNKARAERLNNLIFDIDTEIAKIWNKFKFAELENKLAESKEKLEKAKEILDNFRKEIEAIYDDRYPELKIKAKSNKLKSTALQNGFEDDKKAGLKNLAGYVRGSVIDEEIHFQDCAEKAADALKTQYRIKLDAAFKNTKDSHKGTPALHEKEILDLFYLLVKSDFAEHVIKYVTKEIEHCAERLEDETKRIQGDLTEIVKERQVKMESAIERCKTALKSNYNIDFDLQTPSIDFAFKYQGEATPQSLNIENVTYQMLWGKLRETFTTEQWDDQSGFLNIIKHWIKRLFGKDEINKMCTSLDENMKIYDDKFRPILIGSVRSPLNTEIQNVKDTLTKLVEDVVKDIENQMDVAREFGVQQSKSASSTIDNTRALAEDIDRLNEQKRNLEEIKNFVDEFHDKWLETVKEEVK